MSTLCAFCGRSLGSVLCSGRIRWVRKFGVSGNVPACKACAARDRSTLYDAAGFPPRAVVYRAGAKQWARCPNPVCGGVVYYRPGASMKCVHCGTAVQPTCAPLAEGSPDPDTERRAGAKEAVTEVHLEDAKAYRSISPNIVGTWWLWRERVLYCPGPECAVESSAEYPSREHFEEAIRRGELVPLEGKAANPTPPPAPKLPLPITPGRYRTRDGQVVDVRMEENRECVGATANATFPPGSCMASGNDHRSWRTANGCHCANHAPLDLVERLPDAPEPQDTAGER